MFCMRPVKSMFCPICLMQGVSPCVRRRFDSATLSWCGIRYYVGDGWSARSVAGKRLLQYRGMGVCCLNLHRAGLQGESNSVRRKTFLKHLQCHTPEVKKAKNTG